jgi:malonyl-CoA/methylmalonyl-CoA synthetase
MSDKTVYLRFREVCLNNGSKAALKMANDQVLSYSDLYSLTGQFAAALRSRNVSAGDRVMVRVEKSAANVALYLASLQIGAIFLPLNTAYTESEVRYFADDARPALFVNDTGEALAGVPTVAIGRAPVEGLWQEAASSDPDFSWVDASNEQTAAICYTSGTTGRSKGAMITHGNLASNADTLVALWKISHEDVLLHILPIFHVHGLFVALNTALSVGTSILFETEFSADRVIGLMPQATLMMGVPTHYTRLLAAPTFGRECTAGMRLFLSGSAPLLEETHKSFEDRTGHRILERYGMTEAGMITSNPYDGERVAGTVGFPLPGVAVRVAVQGEGGQGAEAKPGDVGVLEIRGPNVFAGYWEMPEKTEETFTQDGWMITGDMVTQDAEGRISIVGREKDLIISGGYNIYPKEIEAVIDDVAGVLESAVIGIPHPVFGETVVAVIAKQPGREVAIADLEAAYTKELAKFKHPRIHQFVPELPRNTMGKVQKASLRQQYADQ